MNRTSARKIYRIRNRADGTLAIARGEVAIFSAQHRRFVDRITLATASAIELTRAQAARLTQQWCGVWEFLDTPEAELDCETAAVLFSTFATLFAGGAVFDVHLVILIRVLARQAKDHLDAFHEDDTSSDDEPDYVSTFTAMSMSSRNSITLDEPTRQRPEGSHAQSLLAERRTQAPIPTPQQADDLLRSGRQQQRPSLILDEPKKAAAPSRARQSKGHKAAALCEVA